MPAKVHFRPEQEAIILGYTGGKMGISAVPGSGKTFTLAHLAARLVEDLTSRGLVDGISRQEVLIVTFTNSAVNSFRSKIAEILGQERHLLSHVGYQVRTLHGLARDIVQERPSLAGLAEDFQILDEKEATRLIDEIVRSLLGEYGSVFDHYLNPDAVASEGQRRRVQQKNLPDLAASLGLQFVKHAKNYSLNPEDLRARLAAYPHDLPLVRFGLSVYEDYQRSLSYRTAVDFDDLVRLALQVLHEDAACLERLQERWPFILEDEAQDSSLLQETMLRQLSHGRNWVRVGDPNQAINTTFTTADPHFLHAFLASEDVEARPLHTSGRSSLPIIDLANALVRWACHDHPEAKLREAFIEQAIVPTSKDDPQPNPPQENYPVVLFSDPAQNVKPETELKLVADNIERFVVEHPDYTVAVLAPENSHGYKLAEILKAQGVDYEELLRSTSATRQTAEVLRVVLNFLSNPLNVNALVALYRDVWSSGVDQAAEDPRLQAAVRALAGCRQPEQFLWPVPSADWLDTVPVFKDDLDLRTELVAFRAQVQIWLEATILPIDQLVLTLTQDLFTDPADIALGHKIAGVLRGLAQSNPALRLPEFVFELHEISSNQRKFIGFDDSERGYEARPGQVTVATMHAAKGLEWDRVYLMGVSNYGFPSAQSYDNYLSERWFVRDELNLEAEILAQLRVLEDGAPYREGEASVQARYDYAAERLRLLYVGMTRARRSLVITWNMGRFWDKGGAFVNRPALPLVALGEIQRLANGDGSSHA